MNRSSNRFTINLQPTQLNKIILKMFEEKECGAVPPEIYQFPPEESKLPEFCVELLALFASWHKHVMTHSILKSVVQNYEFLHKRRQSEGKYLLSDEEKAWDAAKRRVAEFETKDPDCVCSKFKKLVYNTP